MRNLIAAISLCLACAGMAQAEELVIASNEAPPYVSSKPEDSFLTELFQEIGKEMGVTFVFKFMPWKRCTTALDTAEAWGAVPYIRTPEREQQYLFSDSVYSRKMKFFYYSRDGKKLDVDFNDLRDLRKYRIGGVDGFWYIKLFSDAGITLDLGINLERNFEKLQARRFDLAIADENVGQHLINKRFTSEGGGRFLSVEKAFDINATYLMVSRRYRNTEQLLRQFNKALHNVKKNGAFKRIAATHGLPLTD
ncbi:substrate-binding periplasmic protein [Pseudoduganella namucuonensis]|uniref:Amino acid ABC transporter substrate-binding protein, PAAT family n=1 Tax=Pseudoduganella namucuonensis TaxID=1035707 RepID=A0A1I7JMS4_9BURK|nr:transporter substrate-binding domain-containing protein [Pseudoduganella namucuonensis]SFU86447.1 amino acid ABC transporter substrate-binding protein, PAAT family [Pseudoduganella namucuonensis]